MIKQSKLNERESGIELLKIIAILLIVISHVTQTLSTVSNQMNPLYTLNLNNVTNNIQYLILAFIRNFGAQGNIIFFICSSWFLLESKKINKRKILNIILNVFVINVLVLIIFKLFGIWSISTNVLIKCLFPITFGLNWYITYYLLFYCIHLGLNNIIYSLSKKQLLITNFCMLLLYFGINFIHNTHFAYNNLICFITIYFLIAYIKLYLSNLSNNKKINIIFLVSGIILLVLLELIINFLGQYIPFFSDKLLYFVKNNNPFVLIIGISIFNLFRQKKFCNNFINYISSLTLLVYIIHDNILIRQYIRPFVWEFIYNNFGYNYIIFMDLLFALILFIVSIILALIYKSTLQKLVNKISNYVYEFFSKIFNKFFDILLKV